MAWHYISRTFPFIKNLIFYIVFSFAVEWRQSKWWKSDCFERGGKEAHSFVWVKSRIFFFTQCDTYLFATYALRLHCGFCHCCAQHLKLKEIVDNKNHTEFFEDEKELLWKLRGEVRAHYPESLSKLLLITKWNKCEDVTQVNPAVWRVLECAVCVIHYQT